VKTGPILVERLKYARASIHSSKLTEQKLSRDWYDRNDLGIVVLFEGEGWVP